MAEEIFESSKFVVVADVLKTAMTALTTGEGGRVIVSSQDLSGLDLASLKVSDLNQTTILETLEISGIEWDPFTLTAKLTILIGKDLGSFVFRSLWVTTWPDLATASLFAVVSFPTGVSKIRSHDSRSELRYDLVVKHTPESAMAGIKLLLYEDQLKVKVSDQVALVDKIKSIMLKFVDIEYETQKAKIGQFFWYPSIAPFLPHALSCIGGVYERRYHPILFERLSPFQDNFCLDADSKGFYYDTDLDLPLESIPLAYGAKPPWFEPVGADFGRMLCMGSESSNYGFLRQTSNSAYMGKSFEDQFKSHLHTGTVHINYGGGGRTGVHYGSTGSGGSGSTGSTIVTDYGTTYSSGAINEAYSTTPFRAESKTLSKSHSHTVPSHRHTMNHSHALSSHNHSGSVSISNAGNTETSPKHIKLGLFCIDDRILKINQYNTRRADIGSLMNLI